MDQDISFLYSSFLFKKKLKLNFDGINEYVLVFIELACQFDDH
jgi:hypothetical protein